LQRRCGAQRFLTSPFTTCVIALIAPGHGGADLTTVKELMGHKHIAMTLRYAHLVPGHKRAAIAVLDQLQEKVPAIFTTGKGETDRPSLKALET
jgi:hypothetical protein